MKSNPLVSVIIPCFNSAAYISDSLNSVLGQTYDNLEVIVIDDSSSDDSVKIIKAVAEEDKRVKVYQITHSGRPSVPRNYGIAKSSGELIAFIDSDDLWKPDKLERQVPFFLKMEGIVFVYSMSVTFGKVNIFSENYEVLPLHFRAAQSRSDLLKIGNTIPLSSVIVNAQSIKEAGGFDEDPELKVEDYDLWLRLSETGSFLFIPRQLVYYRIHDKQFSADWETKAKRLKYLAEKRKLDIPEYRFIRRKKGLHLVRNFVHLQSLLWVRILGLMDRSK